MGLQERDERVARRRAMQGTGATAVSGWALIVLALFEIAVLWLHDGVGLGDVGDWVRVASVGAALMLVSPAVGIGVGFLVLWRRARARARRD